MQLTFIPLEAHSLLIALVICRTPPFVHAYAAMFMFPMKEIIDAILMILPGRLSSRSFLPTSWAATNEALRLMAKTCKWDVSFFFCNILLAVDYMNLLLREPFTSINALIQLFLDCGR